MTKPSSESIKSKFECVGGCGTVLKIKYNYCPPCYRKEMGVDNYERRHSYKTTEIPTPLEDCKVFSDL